MRHLAQPHMCGWGRAMRLSRPSPLAALKPSARGADAGSMFDVQSALRELVSKHGSDLHLKVDSPPLYRVHGILTHDEHGETLSAEDTERALARPVARPDEAARIHRGARG